MVNWMRADLCVCLQYEQWKTDKSVALARFVGQFSIVSWLSFTQ